MSKCPNIPESAAARGRAVVKAYWELRKGHAGLISRAARLAGISVQAVHGREKNGKALDTPPDPRFVAYARTRSKRMAERKLLQIDEAASIAAEIDARKAAIKAAEQAGEDD